MATPPRERNYSTVTETSSRDRGVGVTLKGATGYDAPWITFSGGVAEVKADIIAAFGFDGTSNAAELDLHDLTVEAAKAFQAQWTVAATLGGKPVGKRSSGAQKAAQAPSSGDSEDDWGIPPVPPHAEPEAPVGPDLAALIAACASVAELKNLWVDHSSVLSPNTDDTNQALIDQWKARGRELSAAA